jgi:hypothetical protein
LRISQRPVSGGDLTPAEADAISKLLERYLLTLEHVDFEQRLARLERELPATSGGQDGQTGPRGHNGHNGHDNQAGQRAQRHQLEPDSPYNFGDAP